MTAATGHGRKESCGSLAVDAGSWMLSFRFWSEAEALPAVA